MASIIPQQGLHRLREREQGRNKNCKKSIAKNTEIVKITKKNIYIYIQMNQPRTVTLTSLMKRARRILQAIGVFSHLDDSWLTEVLHL